MTCLFYTLGMLLLSGVAYFVRDWTHLCYATTLPFLIFFVYIVYLPESPRWLMSQGRFEEVKKIMKNCAKINGKEFPHHLLPELEVIPSTSFNSETNNKPY